MSAICVPPKCLKSCAFKVMSRWVQQLMGTLPNLNRSKDGELTPGAVPPSAVQSQTPPHDLPNNHDGECPNWPQNDVNKAIPVSWGCSSDVNESALFPVPLPLSPQSCLLDGASGMWLWARKTLFPMLWIVLCSSTFQVLLLACVKDMMRT